MKHTTLQVNIAVATFSATFGKIALLCITTSGHTEFAVSNILGYLVDAKEDVLAFGVVSDHFGLDLALVVGHEHGLAGLQLDRVDVLKSGSDDVALQELHDPPGLVEPDAVPVRQGRVFVRLHGLGSASSISLCRL